MPTILITGASRGIGFEFAKQYAHDGWEVIATCRDPSGAKALQELAAGTGSVQIEALDVDDFAAVDGLAQSLTGRALDILINNAGIGGGRQGAMEMDEARFMQVLHTNTVAPLKVSQAFHAHVAASGQRKLAVVSSGMGSITNNRGGQYAYRASKAAVNLIMRGLAADWANDGITVIVFAPGWVRTDMGGPNAMYSPEESISGMRRILDRVTTADSGRFFSHTGEEQPW